MADELFTRGPARRPMTPSGPPKDAAEAEARFWKRYGWPLVVSLLGSVAGANPPTTVETWITTAAQVRDQLGICEAERLAQLLERAAATVRAAAQGDER